MKRYAGGWVGVRGALGAEMPCPAQNRDENMALATKPYFICKRNEHYMENDLIHSCAMAYSDLERDKYEIIFVRDNSIQKLDIVFTEKEFKHLTGVQHLKDITNIADKKSEDLYNEILALQIHETQLCQSSYYNDNISGDPNDIVTVSDRINELTKLKQIFENIHPLQIQENIQPADLKLYKWDKKAYSSKRPHESSVKADLLLEIKNPDGHFTSLHLVFEPNNIVSGMSLTPCNSSRADDGRNHVPNCTILSFKQINIENPTLENEIISISTSELAKIEADLEARKLKDQVNIVYSELKDVRRDYLRGTKNPKIKESVLSKFKNKYNATLSGFSNKKKYGDILLKQLLERLQELVKKDDTVRDEKKFDLIQTEISTIKSELKNRGINEMSIEGLNNKQVNLNHDGTVSLSPVKNLATPKIFDTVSKGIQMFIHDVGMTVRGISADIKDFFSSTTKSDVKQSGKHKVADRPAKVEKPVEARTEKIDRSNKPNLSAVMESKKKEAAKYNKERTVSPQQHKKNKGRDDI